jgi:uncharacterized SAM-binding protein YcdF (DUF218 family)
VRILGIGLFTAFLVFLGGFVVFMQSLDRQEAAVVASGDGIVALTGGVERIPDALDLLAQGRGRRLLISGVNENVSVSQLAQKAPRLRTWLKCCVDLDHQARNTVGNAEETRLWSRLHGYRSLVIVTSSYHMPRALIELQRHMPDVSLIPAPVVTHRLQDPAFWSDVSLLKVLGQEYAKFVVAYVRSCLTSPSAIVEITPVPFRRRA